ncbi:MAG: nucleotide exchange factor GrpE [Opitutales bacterium]|nr:nucleotide exchange factor GrpE [Opitutales bacterium]
MSDKTETSEETKNPDVDEETAAESVETPEVEANAEESYVSDENELVSRLNQAEARAAELQDRLLRTAAEQENYRKRMAREKDDLRKYAIGDLIEDLLPAIDNMKLGLQGATQYDSTEAKNVAYGFEMVINQIKQILGDKGLTEIDPTGGAFDPNLHEATSNQPSDEHDEGVVIQTLRAGYTLNERLLRPATVIVSSGKADAES